MLYELLYFEMDVRGRGVSEKATTHVVTAMSDADAITAASVLLKEQMGGSVIPWAPTLYCGNRKVATSDVSNPALAHRLAFVCATKAFIPA